MLALAVVFPVIGQNSKIGKRLYSEKGCYTCHGLKGDGEGDAGKNLEPRPSSFKGEFKYGDDLEAIVNIIKNGSPGYNNMAPYKDVLTDDEITSLARFIKSFQKRQSTKK